MKIISVVGARPNFMKIAPLVRAIDAYNARCNNPIEHLIVHTGQHYDVRMSGAFFSDLGIPTPDINLEIGSGTDAEQIGKTMIAFEKVLSMHTPNWVVVVGDVNATLSCSVIAKRQNIKVCHIEAGLRSGDMTMPEEVNRLVTDRISDLLFTPDILSSANLLKEGVPKDKIFFVGNIMIDAIEANWKRALNLSITDIIKNNLFEGQITPAINSSNKYGVVTLHRPSNVDHEEVLGPLVEFLLEASSELPLVWPVHPRALKHLQKLELFNQALNNPNFVLLQPLGYLEMTRLNMSAKIMLTDSGGLQEECCIMGTPCLTLRWNTERPITLREYGGVNVLVGNNIDRIRKEFYFSLTLDRNPSRPKLWDGQTANRIIDALMTYTDEEERFTENNVKYLS